MIKFVGNFSTPGLRVLNPGISGLAKLAGILGFGIPELQSLAAAQQ